METRGGPSRRDMALSSAVRRYPHAEFTIRRLMSHNEEFRDMCEELAEAEVALLNIPETPPHLREVRRVEWQALVDRLAAEVGAALRQG